MSINGLPNATQSQSDPRRNGPLFGAGAMVLEISAHSIFTFKLWDARDAGLDGLPGAINIGHGSGDQWEPAGKQVCPS